jgi:high-affinity nickel-transport protein
VRAALSPAEWRRAAGLFAAVAALHALGFIVLLALVIPQHLHIGGRGIFGLGIGMTAYTLGLRHAFDADHVAAIDSTTRKLTNEGHRPLSVGFFFSLGHSTIVFVLAALFAIGVKGLGRAIVGHGSSLHGTTAVAGPVISGSFLLLIGVLNLAIFISVVRVFRSMRRGKFDERELEVQLDKRGLMNRFYGRATRAVKAPWQVYLVGLLFGLGFDTATEVALLAAAGAAAAGGLPWYAILCLPVLFAAGMSLLDTIDGVFMNVACSWAFSSPIRKVFYNLTITGLSVAVALLIGSIELLSALADRLSLGGSWHLAADVNLFGYVIAGLFLLTWVTALCAWRFGRIEERFSASLVES